MSLCAGVDVGGTKIAVCLVDDDTGLVSAREQVPTRPARGGRALLDECLQLVERLAESHSLKAIGIGVCELVDIDGHIASAYTIDWRALDVVGSFAHLGPTRIEADVRAAAIAEATFGAGRGIREPWLYISVGTGISYALVQDGRPFLGARGNALIVGAPPVELVASGRALASLLDVQRAEDVLANPDHEVIVKQAASALGNALATLANALDPAMIVIGGGLGLNRKYRQSVVRAMRPQIEVPQTRTLPVLASRVGSMAVAVGAAIVAARGEVV